MLSRLLGRFFMEVENMIETVDDARIAIMAAGTSWTP